MEFQRILALRGPNLWARFPVLEAWVDLQDLQNSASSEIPGFNSRLQNFLPSLAEHRCSEGVPGGFYQRLERGTYLAHILEHVALELQTLAGTPVAFGRTRMTHKDGVYKVVIRYHSEPLGKAALESARELCLAAVHDRAFDVAGHLENLKAIYAKSRATPLNEAILRAAKERGIPSRLLDGGLIQLGYGSAQHRILNGLTDKTNAVANSIAYDRELTRGLLQAAGVPTPYGNAVYSAAEAWAGAEYNVLPAAIKPRYNSGSGKLIGPLNTQQEVEQAFERASQEGWSAVVEHFVSGDRYQLLVMGSRLAVALKDGVDVTDLVHPEVVARCKDALQVVGLDMAAVDVVTSDITKTLEATQGAVVTVTGQPPLDRFLVVPLPAIAENTACGFATATEPRRDSQAVDHFSVAKPQAEIDAADRVAKSLVAHLFPEGKSGRIPLVSVTGTNGKTTTVRLTAHILGVAHGPVGMCCTEGIYVAGRRTQYGDCSGPKSAKTVLQHSEVNAAVLEVARGGILREGLGYDRADVAILTNIGQGDHLGNGDIETPEQLAYVKSTTVWAVHPTGYAVLNANDPLVVGIASYCPGKIIYFARKEDQPVVVEHRKAGQRVAFVRDNHIILAEGEQETALVSLNKVPLTHGGRVGFHVENALAAAAAGWGLGLPFDQIRKGLETFQPGLDKVPARFNLLDIHGVTVVLDYGHNTSALAYLVETLEQFPHAKRTVLYSAAGDRRDSDIVDQGQLLGNAFDRVIIYEDTYLRGRQQGDITRLFRQGMEKSARVAEVIDVTGGWKGLEIAMVVSKPGDLLVIQPDLIDDGVQFLRKFLDDGGREISLEEATRNPKVAPDALASGAKVEVHANHLGQAVYAAVNLARGEVALIGSGPHTTERSMHSIQVDDDLHIIPNSPLRFLNHSCDPNCGLVIERSAREIAVHALRPIKKGEEMTLDYATFEYQIEAMTGRCLCKTSKCRERIVGYLGLSEEQRRTYGQYIAEYLREADVPVMVPAAEMETATATV